LRNPFNCFTIGQKLKYIRFQRKNTNTKLKINNMNLVKKGIGAGLLFLIVFLVACGGNESP
jgi:hypothetical protein